MERYLYYLKNVLGLKTVLTQTAEPTQLHIYVQDFETYSESEKDLFNKMITATKLSKSDYVIHSIKKSNEPNNEINIETNLNKNRNPHTDQNPTQTSIYLIDQPHADQNNETYSPRILLKQPEFKKTAWEALQRAMLKFSQK